MKKRLFVFISAIIMMAIVATVVSAYQVSHTGSLPIGSTSMHGYLYRSSSSSYEFSAETNISSNPYRDASLSVTVSVTPYNGSTISDSASTSHSTYVEVDTNDVSTTNATSASGSHSATIYDGTQSWGNSGSTSWSKSTGN